MQRWIDQGYAAFSMSDRGFGDSCGSPASRLADPAGVRDRLHPADGHPLRGPRRAAFAGKLVDEGARRPGAIGATGASYGGGMSLALAALRNRTMMPDGSLVPWTSPRHAAQLAAAAPDIPWSDLAYSLMPNGGTLDYVADSPYSGPARRDEAELRHRPLRPGPGDRPLRDAGHRSRRRRDDLVRAAQRGRALRGLDDILDEVTAHHSSYYIDHSIAPAPVLLTNGWTDDLFPVDEGVRFYNRTRQEYPDEPISLYFSDHGHQRGQNKAADTDAIEQAQYDWLDHLRARAPGPSPTSASGP